MFAEVCWSKQSQVHTQMREGEKIGSTSSVGSSKATLLKSDVLQMPYLKTCHSCSILKILWFESQLTGVLLRVIISRSDILFNKIFLLLDVNDNLNKFRILGLQFLTLKASKAFSVIEEMSVSKHFSFYAFSLFSSPPMLYSGLDVYVYSFLFLKTSNLEI